MHKIQLELAENEAAGYLHTNGKFKSAKNHIECFIITKKNIIQPVVWYADFAETVFTEGHRNVPSADLGRLSKEYLIPQADGYSCASLGLAYLKQLLKDEAKQLRELTLSIPYFDMYNSLHYFFVPSPQVLRYSQSSAYNKYLEAFVMEETAGTFIHKEKPIAYITLKQKLETTITIAKRGMLTSIYAEAESLLEQLPAFRKRWGEAFILMQKQRIPPVSG